MFSRTIDAETSLIALDMPDASALFALIETSRDHLHDWLPWIDDILTLDDARRFIDAAQRQAQAGASLHAGIWYQGQLAGVVALNYIDQLHGQAEIGYWLGAAFQGRGLMTAACRVLVDYVFDTIHLRRVEIRCAAENLRSRAIPGRLGFVEEGSARQLEWARGRYMETIIYAMDAAAWQQRKQKG